MIDKYFIHFEKTIASFSIIKSKELEQIRKDDEFGILRGKLFFDKGSLDFIEVIRFIENKFVKLKYKYHFMDTNNKLIFRYDNVKHHPNISTFPHHKHTKTTILPSQEPDISSILKEIKTI